MLKDFKEVLAGFRKEYVRKAKKKWRTRRNVKRLSVDQKEFEES
jgi:hypothetical protein